MSTSPTPACWTPWPSALDTLIFGGNRILRVYGDAGESRKEFEVIMPDYRLRNAMLKYSRNVAIISLLISLFTATLVYSAIDRIMIRPIRAMTQSMLSFSQAPDDPCRLIQAGAAHRRDRRCRARTGRDAGPAAKDAGRAEASGRSWPRSIQDQSRHAQHAGLGAACCRTG